MKIASKTKKMVEIDNGNSSGKKDELVANYKIFKA